MPPKSLKSNKDDYGGRDLAYWTNVMGLFAKGADPKKFHYEKSCLQKLN